MDFKDLFGIIALTITGSGIFWKVLIENGIKESINTFFQKKLEDYKFILKNSEKVFQFKLDASKELFKIAQDIIPEKTHPDMDWSEACEQITLNYGWLEESLNKFLCEYHATLSPNLYERIQNARKSCFIVKSGVTIDSLDQPPRFNSDAIENAGKLFDIINEAVDVLRIEVQAMIAPPILVRQIKEHYEPTIFSCINKHFCISLGNKILAKRNTRKMDE